MISATRFTNTTILAIGFLLCFQCATLNAQTITLVQATSQGWAGGVCCRHGRNYTIELKIIQRKTPVVLDTLWLFGNCFSIAEYNPKKTSEDDTLYINITKGVVFDDYANNVEIKCYNADKAEGVSFTYYTNGKKKEMDITLYIEELMFIAYP